MPKTRELTIKQRKFVNAYIKTGSKKEAALEAYDTQDGNIAKAIGSENFTKPYLKKEINKALLALELTPNYILNGFKTLHETNLNDNANASTRALENIAQIANLYPSQKSLSMNDGEIKSVSWLE